MNIQYVSSSNGLYQGMAKAIPGSGIGDSSHFWFSVAINLGTGSLPIWTCETEGRTARIMKETFSIASKEFYLFINGKMIQEMARIKVDFVRVIQPDIHLTIVIGGFLAELDKLQGVMEAANEAKDGSHRSVIV